MEHLHRNALVIRGGKLGDVAFLMAKALEAEAPDPDGVGFASLSVRVGNTHGDEDVEQVFYNLCENLPSVNLRKSSAGRLFDAGFDLVKTRPDQYHFSVRLDTDTLQESVEDFIACFDEPIKNPRKP